MTMSDELREALDRLPRLRITGEQLDAIDPDPEKVVYTDWDEWDEYVRLDAVRAALAARPGREQEAYDAGRLAGYEEGLAARPDSPTLDVERLVDAMNDAYEYVNDDYVPALPFMDDIEAFWRPFAAKVLAALAAEAPERPAPETRKQRERDLMASNHAIGRHRGGRPVQGCPLCEDPA